MFNGHTRSHAEQCVMFSSTHKLNLKPIYICISPLSLTPSGSLSVSKRFPVRHQFGFRFDVAWIFRLKLSTRRHASCKGSVTPESGGREEDTQEETPCSKSKFIFYGCQMSRLLQDHHSVQPRSDGGAVCRLLHGPLSAHRGESSPHRRMFVQEETALV